MYGCTLKLVENVGTFEWQTFGLLFRYWWQLCRRKKSGNPALAPL